MNSFFRLIAAVTALVIGGAASAQVTQQFGSINVTNNTTFSGSSGRLISVNPLSAFNVASDVTPFVELEVDSTSTSSPRGLMSAQFSTGTDGARFHMRKARGTRAAPTTVVTGDNLGRLVATGYDGSNYLEMASILFGTEGTIAATRVPTNIQFFTGTNAAPSVLTRALLIDSAGGLTADIGNLTFSTTGKGLTLHNGGSITGASGAVTVTPTSGSDLNLTTAAAGSVVIPTLLKLSSTSGTSAGGILAGADTAWYRAAAGFTATENLSGASVGSYWRGNGAVNKLGFTWSTDGAIDSVGALIFRTNGVTGTTALTLGSDQSATFAGNLTLSGSGKSISTANGAIGAQLQGIATTSTDGLYSINATDATSGVPVQQPGRFRFRGNAWNTTATAATNQVESYMELRPASAATPTGTLAWAFRVSASGTGSYTDAMTLTNAGVLTTAGGITSGGNVFVAASSALTWTGKGGIASSASGVHQFAVSGFGSGASIDTTTADTFKFKNFANNADAAITAAGGTFSGTLGSSGFARVTGDATNATATMSNLTNLSVTVAAGIHYIGTVTLFANDSTGADGLAFDLGGGSCTFTDLEFGFTAQPTGSTLGTVTSTTSTTPVTLTVVSTSDAVYTLSFGFTCNAGGTFIPRFAQNSHSAGTATVRKNSGINLVVSTN